MTLALSHGLRVRQWLAYLKGWLAGRSGRPWAAELAGDYAGVELSQQVRTVAAATNQRLVGAPDKFDDVLAYKREMDELYALQRDIQYASRSRAWLWQRAAHTRSQSRLAEWTAYARRNSSDKVMTAARQPLDQAGEVPLEKVIGN